jgi:hypothetical protein
MEIPVTLEILPSNDGSGVKLWLRAKDGSGDARFKWYENIHVAAIDADQIQLTDGVTKVQEASERFLTGATRKLLVQTEVDSEVLNTHWTHVRKG